MAPSRLATSITLSSGTNRNSACGSMNLRMSHGQATRSTFTRSRVIHFMAWSSHSWLLFNGHFKCCWLDLADYPVRERHDHLCVSVACRGWDSHGAQESFLSLSVVDFHGHLQRFVVLRLAWELHCEGGQSSLRQLIQIRLQRTKR